MPELDARRQKLKDHFIAARGYWHLAGVLHRVIEVHDLESGGKTESPHVGQPFGAVDEQYHEHGQGQAPADGLLTQQRAELCDRPHGGDVGG